ncbi:sugar kinase [Clostridium baratii]|uniref:sugar kinase n=1 Tax=Clostridium baratii TaxID=1561 RepID=UPI00097FB04B|nr:sugar kinase [Clostridium baratii]AQM59278.1 2-keto-3-deoxygluconate kinase [Clostridium baratii]
MVLDVITIGDGMISMCPIKKGPIMFSNTFERKIGGAELNVAIGCSRLGLKSGWISKLGKDDFGKFIKKAVMGEGVDVSKVDLVEDYVTSVYFREILSDGTSRSFYYRENSPTEKLEINKDYEEYFKNAKILHITGVLPSINDNNKKVILDAISLAKKYNLTISFDPNIRLKMWTKEEATEFINKILNKVDILLIGDEEVELLNGHSDLERAIDGFHNLGVKNVIIKRGKDGAIGSSGDKVCYSPSIKPRAVVDTVGAGDGFVSGFLAAYLKGKSLEETLEFANAVGSLVVGVEGDNEGLPYYEDVLVHLGKNKVIER